MTLDEQPLTFGQKLYLFLLRAMGWVGLMFVPLFAFGWATGHMRPDFPLAYVAAVSAPGLLLSIYLTGTPNRPTLLLRPTSFLKAFFICGFFIGMASGLIMLQVMAMVMPIDTGALFVSLGLPDWEMQLTQVIGRIYGTHEVAALQAKTGYFFAVALCVAYPGAILANLAAIVGWFVRFPKRVEAPVSRFKQTGPAYNEEKARAIREMRKRQMARSAT